MHISQSSMPSYGDYFKRGAISWSFSTNFTSKIRYKSLRFSPKSFPARNFAKTRSLYKTDKSFDTRFHAFSAWKRERAVTLMPLHEKNHEKFAFFGIFFAIPPLRHLTKWQKYATISLYFIMPKCFFAQIKYPKFE